MLFVGEEEQTERHDFPLFRPPGNMGSWCQQHRQTTFSSPRKHTGLGVVPRRASARIVCVVSAAHDVPQVGILCGSATPNAGRSACRLLGGAVSIAPQGICHETKRGMVLNKTGYTYEQIGGVYKSLAEVGVYPGGLLTKWGGL